MHDLDHDLGELGNQIEEPVLRYPQGHQPRRRQHRGGARYVAQNGDLADYIVAPDIRHLHRPMIRLDDDVRRAIQHDVGGVALLALLAVPAAAQVPSPTAASVQAPPGKVKLPPARSVLDQVRRAGVLRVGVVEQIPWTFTSRSGQL